MSCFLCHEGYSSYGALQSHIKDDHAASHDVNLLGLLHLISGNEKLALRKQLEERMRSSDDAEDTDVATCKESNVASKVMFWRQVGKQPSHTFREPDTSLHIFNNKDESSEETGNNTVNIFNDIFDDNFEHTLTESVDHEFERLLENETAEPTAAEPTAADEIAVVPSPSHRRRRRNRSPKIQWWRFFWSIM